MSNVQAIRLRDLFQDKLWKIIRSTTRGMSYLGVLHDQLPNVVVKLLIIDRSEPEEEEEGGGNEEDRSISLDKFFVR